LELRSLLTDFFDFFDDFDLLSFYLWLRLLLFEIDLDLELQDLVYIRFYFTTGFTFI